MRLSIVWLRRLVCEYGSSSPISLDLCADDEDPSQLIIRPGWDAPHVRCFPRTLCAWPCLLRQVGMVLGSPYDCVVAGLAYANPGSRHSSPLCSSCIRPRELPYMIEAHIYFFFCCYAEFAGIRWIMRLCSDCD